mmetsp:Transcript_4095/g.17102  ORF Transcript_4095/g.17102 Transcript_4095/m.17102 type:complete len:149 (+) Transcript_4095:110-556(+)
MERFLTSRGPSRVGGWSSIFKRFLQSNGFEGQVQLQHHFFTSKVAPKHKQIPVLFIHGLLASGRTYRSFVKRKDFVPEREVYTIDLRNHGESPHAQRMDIRTLASDVLAFLDGQGLHGGSQPFLAFRNRFLSIAFLMATILIHADSRP